MLTWDELPGVFPGFAEPERWYRRLQRMAELLEAAAPRVRTSSDPTGVAIRRHFGESLELLRIIDETAGNFETLADVGSGGGFPGLVIAAVRPQLAVHLIEPMQKRAGLLAEIAADLELEDVTVHALRAEDAGRSELREAADIVTARAVAELRVLVEYVAPLTRPGGVIALPKGSGLDEEMEHAGAAFAALHCEPESIVPMRGEISEHGSVLLLRRTGACPERYPRRPGIPAKRPIMS